MEKILIYVNSWDEVKELMPYYNLFSRNREVAWSTDSNQLIQLLSVGKMLVVKQDSYYPDFIVTNEAITDFNSSLVVNINQFLEALE